MGASQAISTLMSRGITLALAGDDLKIQANSPPSDDLRDYLKQHKPELIAALKQEQINTFHARMMQFAKELDHPLPDLLDWYQSPLDMETLGSISMDETRKAVTFYVKNLDVNRYEGYVPIGYKPGVPTEKTWVMCTNCQHFTPDSITGGGGAGIGDCAEDVSASPPCYSKAQRHCAEYQSRTGNVLSR